MVNKDLDNIVVISIYDSGYDQSIMENGIVNRGYEYRGRLDAYEMKKDVSKLKEMFPNKTIIICEDGDIEVIE